MVAPNRNKALTGTDKKKRLDKIVTSSMPTMPASVKVDKVAAAMWTSLTQELAGCGLLSSLDRNLLDMYCSTWSKYKACTDDRLGIALCRQLNDLGKDLALSPTSRAKLGVSTILQGDGPDLFKDLPGGK